MAAPCWRYAWRPLLLFTGGAGRLNAARRYVSSKAQHVKIASPPPSPWVLHGAVCLQRLPVISQDLSPTETKFMELLRQIELEKSLFSDHELRLLEGAKRMSRKRDGDSDDDDDDDDDEAYRGQEIITAQDLEDMWEQKFKLFQPALRTKASDATDVSSAERCLGDSLVLLVKQDVGSQKVWLLPQLPWETRETLRQTAERALASLPGTTLNATFLGNAPCGFYKYKFPQSIRSENRIGAKVFFFKAVLSGSSNLPPQKDSFVWVKKDELQDYLMPEYLKQVKRFILNL